MTFARKAGIIKSVRERGRNRSLTHDSSSHQSNTPKQKSSPVFRKRRRGFLFICQNFAAPRNILPCKNVSLNGKDEILSQKGGG